jgi:hypothetical protein
MRAEEIAIGAKFGRLYVLAVMPGTHSQSRLCICRCECGKETNVRAEHLLAGKTQSCGCLHDELSRLRARKHGLSKTPEYVAFYNARTRCTSINYSRWADYGGRGIKFLFHSFEEFLATLGPKPGPEYSVDRFPNNDGHYEPGNVRWATREEQMANQHHGKRPTFPFGYRKKHQEMQRSC